MPQSEPERGLDVSVRTRTRVRFLVDRRFLSGRVRTSLSPTPTLLLSQRAAQGPVAPFALLRAGRNSAPHDSPHDGVLLDSDV